jgi:hypothetical protein
VETGTLGDQVVPSCVERLGIWGYYWRYLVYTLLLLHRKPKPLPCLFSSLQKLGHLKLHIVGDVDLSHSLGIDFGCAGYETKFDYNADGWYD